MATAEERRERVMAYLKGKEAEDEEVYEGGSFEWDSDDGPSSWSILAPFALLLPLRVCPSPPGSRAAPNLCAPPR
eukprot:COSAG04_NODE_4298_length_2175_cov_4.178227_2_plen_75_part_00